MSVINKIKIENVRGIDLLEIQGNITSNKPTLIIASNGFGKTSIATAFDSMNSSRIVLEKEDFHLKNEMLKPAIEITDDENSYECTNFKNNIYDKYDIFVINNKQKIKTGQNHVKGMIIPKASTIVNIIAYKNIPEKKRSDYKFTSVKQIFKEKYVCFENSFFVNLTDNYKNHKFILCINSAKAQFDKLMLKKNEKLILNMLNLVIEKKQMEFETLYNDSIIEEIILKFNPFMLNDKSFTNFISVIQIFLHYLTERNVFSKILKYSQYIIFKTTLKEKLSYVNKNWKNINVEEKDRNLVLNISNVKDLSNGERDILCFITQLLSVQIKVSSKRVILIIDEIFDYLDDANIISAQYYLVKLIGFCKEIGVDIFPIILTHLTPIAFKNYSFKKVNEIYLGKNQCNSNLFNINNLLKLRNDKNWSKTTEDNIISKNYLHYSEDYESATKMLIRANVPSDIHSVEKFREVAKKELLKYINDENSDISFVCCGLRIGIEEFVYNKLDTSKKNDFIDKHGTIKKLDYALENGVDIPEIFYLLSIIYNEAMHLDQHCNKLVGIDSKLTNIIIKEMIKEVVSIINK